jgi:hypothetical protein
MSNEFRIKKGKLVVTPLNAPTLDEAGEVAYDSADNKLKVRDDSATRSVVTEDRAATLTNKTIDADSNTITNIENADIKAGAAIDAAKIADGTVSNAEFQRLDGVTSNIQTQLDAKIGTTLNSGQILVGNVSNVATAVTASGDVTVSNTGDVQIVAGAISDTEVNASAAIARTKLASGTADHVIINNGSGVLSSEAQLATTRGGTGVSSSATFPASGTVAVVPGAGVVKSNGTVLSSSNIDLATEVTGILPVANGGTGSSTQNFVDLTTAQTVDGIKTLNDSIALPDTNDASTGNVDALTITDRAAIRLTGAVTNLRGIAAGVNGQLLLVRNVSGADISVLNDNATPTAANRILTGTNGTLTLTNNASIWLKYDSTSQRWCVVGGSGSEGGSSSVVTLTAAENIAIRDLVAVDDSGGAIRSLININAAKTIIGFAKAAATSGNPVNVQTSGVITGFSGLTPGALVYADPNIQGAYVQPPANVSLFLDLYQLIPVGLAISATDIQIFQASSLYKNTVLTNVEQNYGALLSQEYTPGFFGAANYWAAYADSGATPTDGTGGSPAVGMTITKVSEFATSPAFVLNKPASNVQGQGWSGVFRIGADERTRVIDLSFDFLTSANYANNDVTVWIYDLTNNQLIQPSTFQLSRSASATQQSSFFRGQFQANATGTLYRLIFHVATTSASSYTIKVRNLKVRRQSQNPTPQLTVGATVKRATTGQTITSTLSKVQMNAIVSDNNGNYDLTNFRFVVPVAGRYRFGGVLNFANAAGLTNTEVRLRKNGVADIRTSNALASATAGSANAFVFEDNAVAGDFYELWSAANTTVTLFSDATVFGGSNWDVSMITASGFAVAEQARVVGAKYSKAGVQNINSSTITAIDFETRVYDTHSAVTTGAGWIFTAPVSGLYEVFAQLLYGAANWGAGTAAELLVFINGADTERIGRVQVSATGVLDLSVSGQSTYRLNAGDTISVRAFHSRGAVTPTSTSALYNYCTVKRIAGPEAIGAGEVVSVNAVKTSGAHTATGNWQIVTSWTKQSDTHNAFDASSGVFTVPVSGVYMVSGTVGYVTNNTGTRGAEIRKNSGSIIEYEAIIAANPLGIFDAATPFCKSIRCNAGDNLDIRGFQNTGGNLNHSINSGYTTLSIVKVG